MKPEERIIFGDRGRLRASRGHRCEGHSTFGGALTLSSPGSRTGWCFTYEQKRVPVLRAALSFAANSGSDLRKVLVDQNPQAHLNHIRSKGRALKTQCPVEAEKAGL
jgi:hypothetical protein